RRPGSSIVDDVLGFQVAMDDARRVGSGQRSGELRHERPDNLGGERSVTMYHVAKRLACCPLEREVVLAVGLAVVECSHNADMVHPRAVSGLAEEAFHGSGVAPQPLA